MAQASQRPKGGDGEGKKDKALGAGARQGHGVVSKAALLQEGLRAMRGNGAGASGSWHWGLCSPGTC